MLMKIDEGMDESVGCESSENSHSPPLPLSGPSKYSPPLDPLSHHHLLMGKNNGMTPGILASLSALNAMSSAAASYHHHHEFSSLERVPYGSPPATLAPTNDPSANECKLVDYRGQKVAAFVINGETMLCLPQAFELFLKHLVGGLHTVYTKLKRLDIIPIVCNVEQVRILRGLGAIQPGVNRCKLLSCKDFDVLYKDCTTASSRPGRPPKRTSVPLVPLSSHGSHAQFMSLKKHRVENGDYAQYDGTHHNPADILRLEKSPLLANGYNHPPTQIPPMHLLAGQSAAAAAVAAHSALFSPSSLALQPRDCRANPMPSFDSLAARNATWETCRTAYEDFVKQFEKYNHEDYSDSEKSYHANERESGGEGFMMNGNLSGSSPVLNLSKNTNEVASDESEDDIGREDDEDFSDSEKKRDKYDSDGRIKPGEEECKNLALDGGQSVHESHGSGHFGEISDPELSIGLTSNENLLRNIQGLLKVAAENAKQQERRVNFEKGEFKVELLRERELREQLEKQLIEERNLRLFYEKRYKKERKFRKTLRDNTHIHHDDSSSSPTSGGKSISSLHHIQNLHLQNDHSPPPPHSLHNNNEIPKNNGSSENSVKFHSSTSSHLLSAQSNMSKGESGDR